MKAKLFLTAIVLCTHFNTQASEVDSGQITTFESGTPARASEVNNTLQALIDAINDNAARIEALEAASERNVAGRTYALRGNGVIFIGGPNDSYGDGFGNASAGTFLDSGTVTFAADGTLSLSLTFYEGEIGMNDGGLYQDGAEAENWEASGTWTQSGSDLTLVIPGEDVVELMVSKDGSTVILAEFDAGADEEACTGCQRIESSILVGVEI